MNSDKRWSPIPTFVSQVPPIQLVLIIMLMLMGGMLLVYGIRIQVKLAGLLIDLTTMTLFLVKDKKVLNVKEYIQMALTIILVVIMGVTVCKMLMVDGPQPLTPKNYIPPSKVIEKRLVEDNKSNELGRVYK